MNALLAAKAYQAIQSGNPPTGGAAQASAPGFGELLSNVMNEAQATSKAAETQMAAGVQGRAELVDVVTAVASAEASLETVMAVRDQVIQAYQEIMRMPI